MAATAREEEEEEKQGKGVRSLTFASARRGLRCLKRLLLRGCY